MIIPNGSTDVTTYFVMRDSTNHAPKTDVTVTNIDIYYQEQGAAQSAKADLTALAAADSAHADNKGFHCGNGVYRIDWPDAAFDGGIGKRAYLIVVCTGCDTLYREVLLSPQVDVQSISGDSAAADNCEAFFDGTGYAGTNNVIPTTTTVTNMVTANVTQISGDSTAADNLELYCDGTTPQPVNVTQMGGSALSTSTAQIGVNVIQAAGTAWGSGAITAGSIASNAIAAAKIATGAITNAKFAAGAIDAAAIAADAIGASELAADAVTEIVTGVWNAATASYGGAGTYGQAIEDAIADTNELQAEFVDGGRLDLLIDAIKARTDNLPTDPADQSAVEAAITTAHSTTNGKIDTIDDFLDTEIADIHDTLDLVHVDVDAILEDTSTTIPAAITAVAAAVWNYLISAMTTVGSIGKSFAAWLPITPAGASPVTASDLSICNNALLMLGNTTITSLTDDTKAAKLCAQFYHQTVYAVLRAYTWNCATVRSAALTATTAPTFGFSYAFTLPADCGRVLMIEDDQTIPFKVENNKLLTDESTVKISYIKRISIADADSLLLEAISARLAATIAFPLTNSTSAAEAMWKLYEKKLDEAQSVDAFEGTAPQMASDDWINSRS